LGYWPCPADLDGDGDLDVLSPVAVWGENWDEDYGGWIPMQIAWYANDGSGQFGSQQVIITETGEAGLVYAADLDGDGDLDVLSASSRDSKIAWYANDGSGHFGSRQMIGTMAWVYGAARLCVADLDGDGDMDVLSASYYWDNKIAWYANDGTGLFGPQQVISTAAVGASSVYAADLDGDGDLDVLSASVVDDKIAWYENE